MAITAQDIYAAADRIAAEGGNPTLAAVRKALGSGSFTTISEAMQDWKAKHQAQTATAPIKEPAPASVSEKLTVFGSELWAMALDMANSRLQSEREALEQVRQELELTQKEAIDLADQLSSELDLAQTTLHQQSEALKTASSEAEALLDQIESEQRARYEADRKSEIAAAALVEVHQQITALNAHINELKAENKALRAETSATFQRAVHAEAETAKTLEQLKNIKNELDRETARYERELDRAAKAQAEKESALKEMTSQLESALAAASQSAQNEKLLEGKIEGMKNQSELYRDYMGVIKRLDPQ